MRVVGLMLIVMLLVGCSQKGAVTPAARSKPAAVEYYQVDAAAAGSVTGTIRYTGASRRRK